LLGPTIFVPYFRSPSPPPYRRGEAPTLPCTPRPKWAPVDQSRVRIHTHFSPAADLPPPFRLPTNLLIAFAAPVEWSGEDSPFPSNKTRSSVLWKSPGERPPRLVLSLPPLSQARSINRSQRRLDGLCDVFSSDQKGILLPFSPPEFLLPPHCWKILRHAVSSDKPPFSAGFSLNVFDTPFCASDSRCVQSALLHVQLVP